MSPESNKRQIQSKQLDQINAQRRTLNKEIANERMTFGIVKSFESVTLERPLDAFTLCCIITINLFLIAKMFLIILYTLQ